VAALSSLLFCIAGALGGFKVGKFISCRVTLAKTKLDVTDGEEP